MLHFRHLIVVYNNGQQQIHVLVHHVKNLTYHVFTESLEEKSFPVHQTNIQI